MPELSEMQARCRAICSMGQFDCFKCAEPMKSPINADSRGEIWRFVNRFYAFRKTFGEATTISSVLHACCKTQIRQPVVTRLAVNMIDFARWPFAMNIKPCQPMRFIILIIDLNTAIAVHVFRICDFPAWSAGSGNTPAENASLRVIMKKVMQAFLSKISDSYDRLLSGIKVRGAAFACSAPILT